VASSCEYGNEPSGSIKGEEFLDPLSDFQLLKKKKKKKDPCLHELVINKMGCTYNHLFSYTKFVERITL